MQAKPTRVLFVSKNNAARSLLAQACLRQLGGASFEVESCGVPGLTPEKPDATALAILSTSEFGTTGLQPKDWGDFICCPIFNRHVNFYRITVRVKTIESACYL